MPDITADPRQRPQWSEIVLAGEPSAVAVARREVRRVVAEWGLQDDRAVILAELVATELVANAVRHAKSRSTLCISADRTTVTLNVSDESAAPPVPRSANDEGGRGLMIIEAVSASWGYVEHPEDGKTVWARLTLSPAES